MDKLHAYILLEFVRSAKWEGKLTALAEEIKKFLIENGGNISKEEAKDLMQKYHE